VKKIIINSLLLIVTSAFFLFLIEHFQDALFLSSSKNSPRLVAGLAIPKPNGSYQAFAYFTFTTLCFGLASMIFGFVSIGTRKLKNRNLYLENLVQNRTTILEKKHQELHQQNEVHKEALIHIQKQKFEIENAQADLLQKNVDIQEALEEIKAQNELIDYERGKLHQAKQIIQTQNVKLLSIVRNLDQKVQERTAEVSVANALLVDKNKELDDFIYKSAHDLRGPIARFKGLSHLITIEYSLGNDISKHLQYLEHSAGDMDTMLGRLSNVYEISSRPIRPQHTKVQDIIGTVIDRLKEEGTSEHIDIETNNKIKTKIAVDPSMLHLILKNLIYNSIRFYDPAKKKSWIRIDLSIVNDELCILLTDNGIGIEKEQQKNIFDLFFVGDGNESSRGPGLGLYICKIISRKMKGDIKLNYSKPFHGSAFEVNIPVY
jgi:signal transduction histidine kinase